MNYFVMDENTFGIIRPEQPGQLEVLSSSPIRGALYSWVDGLIPVHTHSTLRPATREDFASFRVQCPPGFEG